MRTALKIIGFMAVCLGVASASMAYDPLQSQVKTKTTSFNGGLSTADTDGQKAFDTLDDKVPSGGAAPLNATFITQTANSTLSGEQALGSLATGLVKNTTSTGVLSIAAAGTDYQAPGNYITSLTGDGTASGPGASSLTLSNSGVSAGTYVFPSLTFDAKGRATSASVSSYWDISTGTLTVTDIETTPHRWPAAVLLPLIGDTPFYFGVNDDGGLDNDDVGEIGYGSLFSNTIIYLTNTSRLGVNDSTPDAYFDVDGIVPDAISATPGTDATRTFGVLGAVGGATSITTTGTGGIGGTIVVTGGAGGQAPSAATASTGGAGGGYTLTAGAGGAASVSGTGTNTGGQGGGILMNSGNGGAANGNTSGTNTSGAGGNFQIAAGNGGTASTGSGTLTSGNGGFVQIDGGAGGGGGTSGGTGGQVQIRGGNAGSTQGAAGGAVNLIGRAGTSTGSGGAGGSISLTAGNASGDGTASRGAGAITFTAGNSIAGGTAGPITATGGTGGVGSGSTGATGGVITLTPGPGGVGSSTGGVGGALVLNGGLGGDASTDGAGGVITFNVASTITRSEIARVNANGLGIDTANSSVLAYVGGTLNVTNTSQGNVGTGEDTLKLYTISANTINTDKQYIEVECWGTYAANGNNKTVKLKFGSTNIYDTGAIAANGGSWYVKGTIIRTGSATQIAVAHFSSSNSSVVAGSQTSSPTETLSGTVNVSCTGEATSNNDVVQLGMIIKWGPAV